MGCAVVVHVPVHGEAVFAEELESVHPDVVRLWLWIVSIFGVDGVDPCEGDESSSIVGVPVYL